MMDRIYGEMEHVSHAIRVCLRSFHFFSFIFLPSMGGEQEGEDDGDLNFMNSGLTLNDVDFIMLYGLALPIYRLVH